MEQVTITVEAEINPTESQEKVVQAVRNIFGDIELNVKPSRKGDVLKGEGKGRESLVKLCDLLRRERIRSAARTVLIGGMEERTIDFCLNKQVAYVGHISFSEGTAESALGPIKVKLECESPRELIDWLAPKIT